TNIAADHLGDYGIHDLPGLAAAKMVIARAVKPDGRAVLNADDAELVAAAGRVTAPLVWFTLDPGNPVVARHVVTGGEAVVMEDGFLVVRRGGERTPVVRVEEVPITLGGAARYNVANALGAVGLALAVGLPVEAMAAGLRQ